MALLLAMLGCAGTETRAAPPAPTPTPSSAPSAPPAPTVVVVSSGTSPHERHYAMADLEALDHQRAYLELVQHLGDIPPPSRDAAWEGLAVRGSIGLLDTTRQSDDPAAALMTADELTAQYPVLMKSRSFTQRRAEIGIEGFTLCYERSRGASCTESLLRFIERDSSNTDLAMNAGRLVIKNQFAYVAIRFFKVAVAGKKHPKECEDKALQRAVAAAEGNLLNDDPILVAAKGIRAICE